MCFFYELRKLFCVRLLKILPELHTRHVLLIIRINCNRIRCRIQDDVLCHLNMHKWFILISLHRQRLSTRVANMTLSSDNRTRRIIATRHMTQSRRAALCSGPYVMSAILLQCCCCHVLSNLLTLLIIQWEGLRVGKKNHFEMDMNTYLPST